MALIYRFVIDLGQVAIFETTHSATLLQGSVKPLMGMEAPYLLRRPRARHRRRQMWPWPYS